MKLFGLDAKKDKKSIAITLGFMILLTVTLNGYVRTMQTFFDASNSDKLKDSLLRAGAYTTGGGSGGGGGIISVPPAVAVIELLNPEDSYDLLNPFSARQIAGVLVDVEPLSHVVAILGYFDTADLISILRELPDSMSGNLVLLFNVDLASNVISSFDFKDVNIIQAMLDSDINKSAVMIEGVVKIIIEGLDPSDRSAALENLSSNLIQLDVESLLDLFIVILNLPETPSTVSFILESMSIGNSTYMVETWLEIKDPESLGDVFDYFSDEYLSTLYSSISNQAREIIYTYLSPETIERLPSLGIFQVSNLLVSSDELETGDTLVVSFTVSNNGNATDDYSLALRLNNIVWEIFSGTLGIGESKSETYSRIMESPGEYVISVLDESATFMVIEPVSPLTPAQLIVTSLEVIPLEVQQGENLLIATKISNLGDLLGSELIDLLIDNEIVDSKVAEIQGGETITLIFDQIASYEPGDHTASVQEKVVEFTIISPPASSKPWATIIITLLVALVGISYILNQRGIINLPFPF